MIDFINRFVAKFILVLSSLRYLDALTWEQVAVQTGGNNTADSIGMIYDRFLKGA